MVYYRARLLFGGKMFGTRRKLERRMSTRTEAPLDVNFLAFVEYAGVLLGTVSYADAIFRLNDAGYVRSPRGQLAGRHREVGIRSIGAFRMFQNIF